MRSECLGQDKARQGEAASFPRQSGVTGDYRGRAETGAGGG